MTTLQRWADTKKRIQAGVVAASASFLEAKKIVSERCGQTMYCPGFFVHPKQDGIWVQWKNHTFFFEKNGNWRDGVGRGNRPVLEQHWPTGLSEATELADALEAVTTGGIIAAWERSQV